MKPRNIDLHGLTLEEAEAKIRDTIDAIQGEATAAFVASVGTDFVDVDAVERRAELVQIIEKVRGGKGLQ